MSSLPEPPPRPEARNAVRAVDSHAHVFRQDLPYAEVRRHTPDFDALLPDYLARLDASGISHAVLVQPSFLGTDNSFLLAALRTHPGRLRGVVVVDADATTATTLRGWAAQGVCGVRLNLVGAAIPDLRGGSWPALLREVSALDWHVEVHIGLDALPSVGQAVIDSGCRLVVDHFGRPGAADREAWAWLLASAGTRRVWVKLSAAYRNWSGAKSDRATAAAADLLAHFGADRLVWGSDWPHTEHRALASIPSALAALEAWVPDEAARRRILVDTPSHLFRFTPGDNRHDPI
ncbi:MAG: amidohydrolase family protein [Xylophilus ampelinus]